MLTPGIERLHGKAGTCDEHHKRSGGPCRRLVVAKQRNPCLQLLATHTKKFVRLAVAATGRELRLAANPQQGGVRHRPIVELAYGAAAAIHAFELV